MKGNGYSADTPSAQEYPFLCFLIYNKVCGNFVSSMIFFCEQGRNLDSCHPSGRICQETLSLACRGSESIRKLAFILISRAESNHKPSHLPFSEVREVLVSRLLVFSQCRERIAIVSSYLPNCVRLMQPFATNLPTGRQLTTPRPKLARNQLIPLYIYVRFHLKTNSIHHLKI